jgi:hypothetical protein
VVFSFMIILSATSFCKACLSSLNFKNDNYLHLGHTKKSHECWKWCCVWLPPLCLASWPLAYVNQPKLLLASEGHYVIPTLNMLVIRGEMGRVQQLEEDVEVIDPWDCILWPLLFSWYCFGENITIQHAEMSWKTFYIIIQYFIIYYL